MPSHFTRALFSLALCLLPAYAEAQAKREAERPKVFCEPSRAVALVGDQLSEAKAFGDPVKRIAVMTRAASMLWPHEREQARGVFAEAFELASRHYRERGDETRREKGRADSKLPGITVQLPDQRFVVLRALARRDAAWARELAARAAEETREEAEKNEATAKRRGQPVGGKLLLLAESVLESDRQTALALARGSFAEPATMYLPYFLYKLAGSDRPAADSLFKEALAAYADRDVQSLLHLSEYPFALTSPIAPTSSSMGVGLPKGFDADPELQRLFVNAFLGLAGRRLAALTQEPPAEESPYRETEPELFYAALKALEALYGARQPAALERITALEGQAVALLSPARQRNAAGYAQRDSGDAAAVPRGGEFDAALARAERVPPARRDQYYSMAVTWNSSAEPLEKVEAAAQKVEDAEARRQLLNWLYFSRAQAAAKAGDLDEARKLADRVEALEERALLFLNIASEGLKRSDDKQRAEELLTAVVAAARKSPDTVAKARALLGVASLYARFDYLRGLGVLGEAAATINKLDDPDLGAATFMRAIQGKDWSTFMGHPMPDFTVESSFGELGARDFEATVLAAGGLTDKYLRAAAVLAAVAPCLEESEKQEKQEKQPKPKKPAPSRGARKTS